MLLGSDIGFNDDGSSECSARFDGVENEGHPPRRELAVFAAGDVRHFRAL